MHPRLAFAFHDELEKIALSAKLKARAARKAFHDVMAVNHGMDDVNKIVYMSDDPDFPKMMAGNRRVRQYELFAEGKHIKPDPTMDASAGAAKKTMGPLRERYDFDRKVGKGILAAGAALGLGGAGAYYLRRKRARAAKMEASQ